MIPQQLPSALKLVWTAAAALTAVSTLPGSVELLVLSAAALWPGRARLPADPQGRWRVAVVVPAHNEQVVIARCVAGLQRSCAECAAAADAVGVEAAIFVVADNCTDETARAAETAGANVLVRENPIERGKGYALHYAFGHLIGLGYNCVLVVDADTRVADNFVRIAAKALRAGAAGIQARYLIDNVRDTVRSRLMAMAITAFNVVRPLGRSRLGLSCGIQGTGFGLRSDTLEAVPYLAASIVEDLEYHLTLVRSGRRVQFLNDSTVYAETPVRTADVRSQRARWEGGRLRMLLDNVPRLAADVAAGNWRCLEPMLELLLLPLAFHVTLIAVALSAPVPAIRDLAIAQALIVILHLIAAVRVGEGGLRDAAILAVAPFYVVWKLLLIPTLIRSASARQTWKKTGRNAEPTASGAPSDPAPQPEMTRETR